MKPSYEPSTLTFSHIDLCHRVTRAVQYRASLIALVLAAGCNSSTETSDPASLDTEGGYSAEGRGAADDSDAEMVEAVGEGGSGADSEATDLCGDGLDNNENGAIDEDCSCAPGTTQPCYLGTPDAVASGNCIAGTQTCSVSNSGEFASSTWGACIGAVECKLEEPDNDIPDNAVPDGSVPDDGVPDDGVPDDGIPDDGIPDDGAPPPHQPIPCSLVFADMTLSKPGFGFRSLTLDTTTLSLSGSNVGYTTIIYNDGVTAEYGTSLQAYIEQGSADCAAAGGKMLQATESLGQLPPGDHEDGFTVGASNNPNVVSEGQLSPGPALVRLQLLDAAGGHLAEIQVPIQLVP